MKNENKNETKTIYVERETFEKDDKTYYSYFIKGKVRGKEIKVAVIPPDRGGYSVLDIVFGNEMKAELTLTPYEIKDDSSGKIIKGNTYGVRTYDESGEIYECNIKPYRNSDRTLLQMLLSNK